MNYINPYGPRPSDPIGCMEAAALRRVTLGGRVAEDLDLARRGLNSGLARLSTDPIGCMEAVALRRVMRGSQLAEDLVFADRALNHIIGR